MVIKTILLCAFELIFFIGIPYALLSLPQTNSIMTQTGLADPTFLSELTLFALVTVVLIVVKNFSRPGSIINLASGLALISSGIIFFLVLGSANSSEPRLGYLSFFVPVQGSRMTVTAEFVSLALAWIGIAVLKSVNLVLSFIEARHSRLYLKIPIPPQATLQPLPASQKSRMANP